MTNEILKKLTRVVKDLNSTEKSPESQPVFETQELKSALEINSQRSETNQSNLRTNNHY
jgi:hypothetical protein